MSPTRVKVYHAQRDGYHHVATVDVSGFEFDNAEVNDVLEYAYRWTQNIEGSWSLKLGADANDLVTVHDLDLHLGHRSTNVNDSMVYKGKAYVVKSMGFEQHDFPTVKEEWF
jgi:hypothetical protein